MVYNFPSETKILLLEKQIINNCTFKSTFYFQLFVRSWFYRVFWQDAPLIGITIFGFPIGSRPRWSRPQYYAPTTGTKISNGRTQKAQCLVHTALQKE